VYDARGEWMASACDDMGNRNEQDHSDLRTAFRRRGDDSIDGFTAALGSQNQRPVLGNIAVKTNRNAWKHCSQ
tara:strand:+ start:285 stop:503 length:219 start_codon:yes stop_codon:yes gene_type:complete